MKAGPNWCGRWLPLAVSMLLLVNLTLPGRLPAADFLGATGVLRTLAERHAAGGPRRAETNESAQLTAALQAFAATAAQLPPKDAARQWLALADRAAKTKSQDRARAYSDYGQAAASDLFAALPPPAAWPELARAVSARPPARGNGEIREIGLALLAALLVGDTNATSQVITRLSAKAQAADLPTLYQYRNYLDQLGQALLARSDNPAAILQMLNRQLAAAGPDNSQSLNLPNLAAQVGPEPAREFLRRALLNPNVTLEFYQAGETSRLARQVAREILPQLKVPHWELINSLDAVDLYEAMNRQFGTTNPPVPAAAGIPGLPNLPDLPDPNANSAKSQAQIYYLLGLISQERTAEAVAVAKTMGYREASFGVDEAFKAMEHAGYTAAMDNFFHELLAQHPELPFWSQYVELAAHAGQTERMVALVNHALGQSDLADAKRTELQTIMFKALLADDQVEAGVAQLQRLAAQEDVSRAGDHFNHGQLGVMLARLGVLLKNPAWTEDGIATAQKWLAKNAASPGSRDETGAVVGSLAQILLELQRGPEAEAVLLEALDRATATPDPAANRPWQRSPARPLLTELAVLYHQAGRFDDVLHLLDESPDWGTSDLSGLLDTSPLETPVSVMWLHTGSSPLPVPYLAANALLATGQRAAAEKILAPLQDHFPGLDRCYELLLALEGTNAIPQLDAWFHRDQFEERPLIWKARLLRQAKDLTQAEQVIRQAIAIDPSDGEEGRGDRMRAYAELAEIRAARGDSKEADFYREVVKAIRLSEDADQFYQAGLLKRAIGMYESGLQHFSDAYCIQSRLAIQLSALGRNTEAEEHYRRAYELMPDSFGRVESHCFGCEQAFAGEHAQSVAEKVFTQFAAAHPDKPQVHYLLGYLRQEEDRFPEARTNYLAAVRLDPDYLNAWVKLQEVDEQVLAPAVEHDTIAFNILRLDPLRRHAQVSFDNVQDLAGLWQAAAAAAAQQSPAATNLLTLTASKVAQAKAASRSPVPGLTSDIWESRFEVRQTVTPASLVVKTSLVRLASEMILNQPGGDD